MGNYKILSYLSTGIKELIHTDFDLLKQYRVDSWVQLMSDQLLHVFLYLRSKLLILTNQQL